MSNASKTLSGNQSYNICYWRANEASETLSGVTQWRFRYINFFNNILCRASFSAWASNYVKWAELSDNHFINVITMGNGQ